ncbi:sensor histidine kinase [Texcoconibacillus texcoconensis]|uniref:histidine kinase n=1 Tax=Texcoconibacillus texcoconensis TaxID=1095777 RepID=A0A840QPH0_9BACI|nr:HAMP domain-containing sensor histidine kinase [Texcoconibacillus texcoconensis]MBB5173223.1 signal transduction histidine kinase [Texcoconibacillus texcoconensis]
MVCDEGMRVENNLLLFIDELLEKKTQIINHLIEQSILKGYDGDINKLLPFLNEAFLIIVQSLNKWDDELIERFGELVNHFQNNIPIQFDVVVDGVNFVRKELESVIKDSALKDIEKVEVISKVNEHFFYLQKQLSLDEIQKKTEIIEEKEQLVQLLNHERMTILGKLSTTFAHELGNPLTSLKGFIQLLESRLGKEEQEATYINHIQRDIKQMEEHVQQFLLLSQEQNQTDASKQALDLTKVLREVIDKFKPVFSEQNIRHHIQNYDPAIVYGNEQQLKLSFMKLVNNAVDALLHRKTDRRLAVKLCRREDIYELIFTNNGPKIPDHLQPNIFEPFVSTKELGKGLGLSMCKQVIEKHHGQLTCSSKDDQTTFIVQLNVYESEDWY